MKFSALFAAIGFLLTFVSIPILIELSKRGWGLDHSDRHRKNHEVRIPRTGGLPIFAAFLVLMALLAVLRPQAFANTYFPILICGALIFSLGFWDDLRPIGAKMKLFGQILIAVLAYAMGLRIDLFTYPIGDFSLELGPWGFPMTIFWLILVPNIVNLIDGFDGLAAGLGLFLSVTLGIVAWSSGQFMAAWGSFGIAGSLVAFLFFNFPPAKIFLGDGGAYLIGFCVAAFSLESSNKGAIAAALMVTIVALGLPILDTTFALLRRGIQGVPLFRGDREHIHHRLERLGFSKRRVVLGMYLVCVVLNLVGLSIFWSQGRTLPIAAGVIFLLAVFAVRYLGYIAGFRTLQHQIETSLARRSEIQYALLQGQLMELEVDRCDDGEVFWARFLDAIARSGLARDEDAAQVTLRAVDGTDEVRLGLRGHGATIEHWRRVADCFQRAYSKALHKWPKAIHAHA